MNFENEFKWESCSRTIHRERGGGSGVGWGRKMNQLSCFVILISRVGKSGQDCFVRPWNSTCYAGSACWGSPARDSFAAWAGLGLQGENCPHPPTFCSVHIQSLQLALCSPLLLIVEGPAPPSSVPQECESNTLRFCGDLRTPHTGH